MIGSNIINSAIDVIHISMCVNETALMYRCEMWWFGRELEVLPAQENYFGFGFGTSQKGGARQGWSNEGDNRNQTYPSNFQKNADFFFILFHAVFSRRPCAWSRSRPRDFLSVEAFSKWPPSILNRRSWLVLCSTSSTQPDQGHRRQGEANEIKVMVMVILFTTQSNTVCTTHSFLPKIFFLWSLVYASKLLISSLSFCPSFVISLLPLPTFTSYHIT